jgi:hypothetical protein
MDVYKQQAARRLSSKSISSTVNEERGAKPKGNDIQNLFNAFRSR